MSDTATPLGGQPSRMPNTDLGSAFAPEAPRDRSRGLAGRLPPVAPAEQPATTEAPEPVDAGDSPPPPAAAPAPAHTATPQQERQPTPTSTPAEKAADTADGRKITIVYVHWPVRDRLRAFITHHSDLTYTDVILRALDSTHAQLRDRFTPAEEHAATSLFSGRHAARSRRRQQEPQVQVSFRPWAEDLAVIDRLVDEVKAPNRSALVDTALDLYLPAVPETG